MEKDRIAGVHLQMDQLFAHLVRYALNTIVHLIDAAFPFRVVVSDQLAFVSPWEDDETAVLSRNSFHGCPCTYDSIRRSEWEVVEVLVQWVS